MHIQKPAPSIVNILLTNSYQLSKPILQSGTNIWIKFPYTVEKTPTQINSFRDRFI